MPELLKPIKTSKTHFRIDWKLLNEIIILVGGQFSNDFSARVDAQSTHKVIVTEMSLRVFAVLDSEVIKFRIWIGLDERVSNAVKCVAAIKSHALEVIVELIKRWHFKELAHWRMIKFEQKSIEFKSILTVKLQAHSEGQTKLQYY